MRPDASINFRIAECKFSAKIRGVDALKFLKATTNNLCYDQIMGTKVQARTHQRKRLSFAHSREMCKTMYRWGKSADRKAENCPESPLPGE